jgi:hypothetical protein
MVVTLYPIGGHISAGTKSWLGDLWDDIVGTADDTSESVEVPAAAAGCGFNPDNVCPGGPNPTYPEFMGPSPAIVNASDLEEGAVTIWTPESPRAIANCDGSTEGIRLVCHFAGGDLEVRPDENGNIVIRKTLTDALRSPVMCDLHYVDANNGEELTLPNAIKLYGPTVNYDTGACGTWSDPVIDPTAAINYEPREIYAGDAVLFTFPVRDSNGNYTITKCDGNPVDLENIYFTQDGEWNLTSYDGTNYSFVATFEEPSGANPYLIAINAHDLGHDTTASRVIEIYVSERVDPTTGCEANPRPQAGSLSINPTSLNSLGQIIYGTPVTFDLYNVTDCDGEPSNLSIVLYAGSASIPMTRCGVCGDEFFSATVDAEYWGPPIYAEIRDNDRSTTTTSYIWSLPPIVPPDVTSCEANPYPEAYTVRGPNPGVDYDIASGAPIQWQIWAKNCDDTRNGLSATCDFGPLGLTTVPGDSSGVITVEMAFPERLTGFFPCDIRGSNGYVLDNGAVFYPPYYLTPLSSPTNCEMTGNRPQVGNLTVNSSSLNSRGQIVYGTPVTLDLPNTTDCDGEPSSLSVMLYAGTSPVPMALSGTIYSATTTAAYWGVPISAVVTDTARSTTGTSYLWSLPPIVSPTVSACEADPRPQAFTVVGPIPASDYNIASGIPVVWQIFAEDCDGTTDGLSATCNFATLGTAAGTGDSSGIITITKVLTDRLGGRFPCDITGSYGTNSNGAILYPPYYRAP